MGAIQERILAKFLAGQFVAVTEEFENQKTLKAHPELIPFWIGSLVFTGNLEKALAIYEKNKMPESEKVACQFYLSLGHVRQSHYREARLLLANNLKSLKNKRAPLDLFYIYQGVAFYRFFCGRFFLSKKYASLAYKAAVEEHFVFGEMVSKDLLAHSLVQLGQVHKGLKYFEDTLKIAVKAKNQWLIAAIKISLLKFNAQFGLHPETDLKNLQNALSELAPEDTYSIAELLLEMIRQCLLRGDSTQAEQYLAQASDIIYKHQNRRQIAVLNLRMSYMLFLQAQYTQALHVIRFAEQNIDANIDLPLWTQMMGLKKMLFTSLGKNKEAAEIEKMLIFRGEKSQAAINKKMLSRPDKKHDYAVGEDLIGDLLDKVNSGDAKVPLLIVSHGYYGLLHKFYKLPFGADALIFDLIPGSIVTLNKGNVLFRKKGLNSLTRKILLLLKNAPQSKESLVKTIWGYDYDPLRHDTLIYSSINKARKILEPHGDWIVLTEDGYTLRRDVRVIFKNNLNVQKNLKPTRSALSEEPKVVAKQKMVLPTNFKDLNFRQLQIIDYLKKNPSISIFELSSNLAISKPTATRDLSQLHKLGILRRVGKGRATRYLMDSI